MPEWRALAYIAQVYSWQRRGFLPEGRGWLDEAGILVDALELVAAVEAKLTEPMDGGRAQNP